MGIKHLNNLIQTNAPNSLKKIHFNELSGKKIVVDISIYLYRFVSEDVLLENLYLMISLFRNYNIIPLFIFDGKPPIEKKEELKKRKLIKKEAEDKFNQLQVNILDDTTKTQEEINNIQEEMCCLKKQFIKLKMKHIEQAKLLITSYGMTYIEAPGEADKLCAKMVLKNRAYACMSEDMDLFVYGCTRVLRYISLLQKTFIMYDFKNILKDLSLNVENFKQICIVSGTDYNINTTISLSKSIKYFNKFKKSKEPDFLLWLEKNKYIDNIIELYDIENMFNLSLDQTLNNYININIINGPINKYNLCEVMKQEHFIFV